MTILRLVPLYLAGEVDGLAGLAQQLARQFHCQPSVHPPRFDPEQAFDAARGQYHSTRLLQLLLDDVQAEAGQRVLGIADVDLFIPVLTYVFGEAQLNGRAAVISAHRLRNEVYGLPADARLLSERLCKEAVHELGHTYGLLHCKRGECVMASSTYVGNIDLKGIEPCRDCRRQLDAALETSGSTPK